MITITKKQMDDFADSLYTEKDGKIGFVELCGGSLHRNGLNCAMGEISVQFKLNAWNEDSIANEMMARVKFLPKDIIEKNLHKFMNEDINSQVDSDLHDRLEVEIKHNLVLKYKLIYRNMIRYIPAINDNLCAVDENQKPRLGNCLLMKRAEMVQEYLKKLNEIFLDD